MREGVRSYLHSLYISFITGNLDALSPKILSYHRNVIRVANGGRLIVDGRLHLGTCSSGWPGSIYISLGKNSVLHFTGRASIHADSRIVLSENARVTIGDHCVFRDRLWLRAQQEITIGDGTIVGNNTMITDSDLHLIEIEDKCLPDRKPVRLEEHVWIGSRCIILKGVNIGKETVIGAGSLVTRNIPDHVLAYGRPASIQRKIQHWGAA